MRPRMPAWAADLKVAQGPSRPGGHPPHCCTRPCQGQLMRGLLLILRTVVFLLALAGGVSSGFLGLRWREAVLRDQPEPAVHHVQEEVAGHLSRLGLGNTETWAPVEQTPEEKARCSRA